MDGPPTPLISIPPATIFLEVADQRTAQPIARELPRNQVKADLVIHAVSSSFLQIQMNRPHSRACPMHSFGSSMRTSPATMIIPERPAVPAPTTVLRTDGRHVHVPVLAGLRSLVEYACRTGFYVLFANELSCGCEQSIRSLNRLDADAKSTRDDDSLPDIDGPECVKYRPGSTSVFNVLPRRAIHGANSRFGE